MKIRVLLLILIVSLSTAAEPNAPPDSIIVENYWAAARGQEQSIRGVSMEVEIEASLPRLKKHGRLRALRHISALGRITYERFRFEGDNTIKNQVIARYLTAEMEAQKSQAPSVAVTPENYKFKYKGVTQMDGRGTYLFQVTPRQKRQGLYRGDIWIDAQTYLRVQESGSLVKNPSIFLKRVQFVRKYDIRDGLSVPREVQSVIETRLVGTAELTIAYHNFSLDGSTIATGDVEDQ